MNELILGTFGLDPTHDYFPNSSIDDVKVFQKRLRTNPTTPQYILEDQDHTAWYLLQMLAKAEISIEVKNKFKNNS